jgi:CPA2 family monovalent cation:H+ antiporter-2
LQQLLDAADAIEITWVDLLAHSPMIGQTLAQADLRSRTGASVVALFRDEQVLPNPKSMTVFQAGDRIGLIGEAEQIAAAEQLLGIASDPQERDPRLT